jgi:hypothetical protein
MGDFSRTAFFLLPIWGGREGQLTGGADPGWANNNAV